MIRLGKCNPKKSPEDNDQEIHWQIDDKILTSPDDLHNLAWEANFGTNLSDFLIIYTYPNASDFGKSHTHGPITVIVSPSRFHDTSDGQNWDTYPVSDPSTAHPPNPKSHSLNQELGPLQTYVIMIVPNRQLSQVRTFKVNTSLYSIHIEED